MAQKWPYGALLLGNQNLVFWPGDKLQQYIYIHNCVGAQPYVCICSSPCRVHTYGFLHQTQENGKDTMPFIPVPNTLQAELVYSWNNEIVENVLHYESGGAVSLPEMEGLAAALATWFGASMKTQVSNACSLTNVKITDLTFQNAPGIDYSVGLPIVGTVSNESLPNNVSLSIAKRTIFRGRSYRGRVYQVGLCENQVTGNTVIAGTKTALLAAWELVKSFTISGSVYNLVVVSKYSGGAARSEGLTTPVLNFSTDGLIDSQRRRLPGRGT